MGNKLLLLDDVEVLGRSGDIVNVKPGYARNYLLPQGLAVIADKAALRMQARLQEERRKRAIVDKEESEKTANALEGVVLTTTVKVDHEGNMYGSVSTGDIAKLLHEQASIHLEKRFVQLKHALKELGEHTIPLKLKEGVTSTILLKILVEGAPEEEAPPAEKSPKE